VQVERCKVCDRPLSQAKGRELDDVVRDLSLCVPHDPGNDVWGPRCRRAAIDWRQRALDAERERDVERQRCVDAQNAAKEALTIGEQAQDQRDRALTAARELREALEKQAVHRVSRRGGERQWCQICDSYTAPYSPAREEWLKVTHASGCALASTAWLTDGGDNG
jgi:hypothetical protein